MTLPLPFRLQIFDCLDSTNEEAKRQIRQGAGDGTVLQSLTQTAGRGRRGRVWHSSSGNLFVSFVLKSPAGMAVAPQLAFVGAVALHDAVAGLCPGSAVSCKWPNDILLNGRKLAGMLLEAEGDSVILGVGVNLRSAPDQALIPATALQDAGYEISAGDMLAAFAHHLALWRDQWEQQGFPPVRDGWLQRAAGLGQPVTARLANGQELQGLFQGLDAGGTLQLALSDGRIVPILAGDVFFSSQTKEDQNAAGH